MSKPLAETDPELPELGTYYTDNLLWVFSPTRLGAAAISPGITYIENNHQINMPPLELEVEGDFTPLSGRAQDAIHARAIELLSFAHGSMRLSILELRRLQALLDGTSLGMTEKAVADRLAIDRRDFILTSESARDYLNTPNQASVMFNARLHGFLPTTQPRGLEIPRLTHYRKLHLYLGALGFEGTTAADMTGSTPENVKTVRSYIRQLFAAKTFAQAVSNAFTCDYFSPLDLYRMPGGFTSEVHH